MNKESLFSLLLVFTVFVLPVPTVAQAQSAVPAVPPPSPKRMTATVDYVDVPSLTFLTKSQQVHAGQDHDSLLLAALLKAGAQETERRVISTFDGVTGRIGDSVKIPTTTAAGGRRDTLSLDNFVEATPRSNADGTITVALKTQRAVPIPSVTPLVSTTSTLFTTRTLRDGQMLMLGGVVDSTDARSLMHLTFVTVTVLSH